MNHIERLWEEFAEKVLRNPTGETRDKMRLIFFSGAGSLYSVMMNGLSPGAGETTGDLNLLCDVNRELLQFNADLANRVADSDDPAVKDFFTKNPQLRRGRN